MTEKRRYRRVEPAERGFEVVELIKEDGKDFVLVKVPLENMSKLRVLKTDRKRLEYQREAQKRYRKKRSTKQKK